MEDDEHFEEMNVRDLGGESASVNMSHQEAIKRLEDRSVLKNELQSTLRSLDEAPGEHCGYGTVSSESWVPCLQFMRTPCSKLIDLDQRNSLTQFVRKPWVILERARKQ